ncbi:MAG TPA: diguanylate cyclase [Candidatus Hydrogenedentes bacterium]|nr:diguanylate cyclase [Candidatus Hydrogenedentota bacterium]
MPRDFPDAMVALWGGAPVVAEWIRERLIRSLGCEVTLLARDQSPAGYLAARRVDLLVVITPGFPSGLDRVFHEVRRGWPHTAIVLVTPSENPRAHLLALAMGADDICRMPCSPWELVSRLRPWIERSALSRRLERERGRFRSLFDLSPEGLVAVRPDTLEIVEANQAFSRSVRKELDELRGVRLDALTAIEDRKRFEQWLKLCRMVGRGTLENVRMDTGGTSQPYAVSLAAFCDKEEQCLFLHFRDMSETLAARKRREEATRRDPETGLLDRRAFEIQVSTARDFALERQLALTLGLVALDWFKPMATREDPPDVINSLREVGAVIQGGIRVGAGDNVFRFGERTLAVLLQGVGTGTARGIATRILQECAARSGGSYGLSAGLAELSEGMTALDLVRRAEEALLVARNTGPGCVYP